MKFNSFDELISYLYGKDLSALEFEIHDNSEKCNGECPMDDSEAETPATQTVTTVPVTFNSLSDKPVIEFVIGAQSTLLVDAFEHIPNTCSTTKVNIFGRELTIGVCENDDGLPVAKFDVIVDGKVIGIKEFVLVTEADKYTNTICLD